MLMRTGPVGANHTAVLSVRRAEHVLALLLWHAAIDRFDFQTFGPIRTYST